MQTCKNPVHTLLFLFGLFRVIINGRPTVTFAMIPLFVLRKKYLRGFEIAGQDLQ